MPDSQRGLIAVLGTSLIWGFLAVYFKLLGHVPAMDVLAHRVIWSLVSFLVILGVQGKFALLWRTIRSRQGIPILIAALVMGANWFFYILSIQAGHTMEVSIAYYIFPMVAVLIGVVVFRERLATLQWVAIGLATTGILVLTIGLGVAPWSALIIATTFGIYGMIKKTVTVEATISVTAETAFLAPLAALWLLLPHPASPDPAAAHFGSDWITTLLLIGTAPLTAIPLMLFSYASRRIPLSTLGVVLYINPTLQFFVATLLFGEPFTRAHALAFPLIWAAVLLYIISMRRQASAARRLAASLAAQGTP